MYPSGASPLSRALQLTLTLLYVAVNSRPNTGPDSSTGSGSGSGSLATVTSKTSLTLLFSESWAVTVVVSSELAVTDTVANLSSDEFAVAVALGWDSERLTNTTKRGAIPGPVRT